MPEKSFDNRFRCGKCHFEWTPTSDLAPGATGAIFENAILDHDVGLEAALILIDSSPFVQELKHRKPFELSLKAGFAETRVGPILFLLWWVPPIINGMPFALYEHLLNPTSSGTLRGLRQLARQTHLHVVLLGKDQRLCDVFEFENVYGFNNLISPVETASKEHPCMDFAAVKREFDQTYDLMELFRAEP